MRNVISVAAVLAVAGAASAAVTGVRWAEVNNSSAAGNAGWNATNRTFDLFVDGTVGQTINGVNFGGDNPANGRIEIVGGTVFNHTAGSNLRNAAFETFPGFQSIAFDTFAVFGGDRTPGAPGGAGGGVSFAGSVNLTGAGGLIQFTSFTQPPAPMTADALSASGGSIWVLRVTLTPSVGDVLRLGGGDSSVQVGYADGQTPVVTTFAIPDAIPTPGAAALLGLAGLAVARRRR